MRVYGIWAGNPNGILEETNKCIEAVFGSFLYTHQCTRKRGHGKDGLYCKQHARKHQEREDYAKETKS